MKKIYWKILYWIFVISLNLTGIYFIIIKPFIAMYEAAGIQGVLKLIGIILLGLIFIVLIIIILFFLLNKINSNSNE